MPQPHLTSIVIVSFHTGAALFQAIESALHQSLPVEVVVVDNGNPPNVIENLKALARQDPRLILLHGHGNVGFSRANNMGVKASHGDTLLILNPDCLLRMDCIETIYRQTKNILSPYMLGARILNEDGSDQRGCRRALLTPQTAFVEAFHLSSFLPHLRLNFDKDPIPLTLSSIPAISGAFMFLSRQDFDKVGGFDEGYFLHVEDLDLCYRFRQMGGEIYFSPDVVVTHIGGTSEATSDFIERHKMRGFIRYFHQHFSKNTPLILLWCLDIAIWMRYLQRRCLGK